MEFFIGMMVIGIIAGVFVMTILFGSERGFFVGSRSGQRMTIVFQKGGGISQNSLVLKNGIKIGRVYSVELVDDVDRSEVHVSFELEPNMKIYSNEYAKINRTLLGDASIEFVDDPEYVGEVFEIGADDVIPGRNTGDIMGTVSNIEGDLAQALQNINKASEGVSLFMQNINQIFGDDIEVQLKKERLQGVFTDLAGALQSIEQLADNLNLVVSDEEIVENIRRSTSEAPKLLEQVNNLTSGAQDFMDSARDIGAEVRTTLSRAQTTFDLVDKNLDNVSVFTTSLAENGPEIMSALNESSVELRTTFANIHDTVGNISNLAATLNEKLNDPNSALGLLGDEETSESIRQIIKNAEGISRKLYPILDDARVFTNKIAHRPSSLVWDRTTSKGVNVEHKFGLQPLSPKGGLSSPLYRQSAAGSKIHERSYYEPAANTAYMDSATRSAYESSVEELNYVRNQNEYIRSLGAESNATLLPTVSTNGKRQCFGALRQSCAERRERVRWSLASFWNSLTGKNKNDVEIVEVQPLEPSYAAFVNYDQYNDGAAVVGQTVYNAFGNCEIIPNYDQYDASSCAAPQLSECGVPTTTDCASPDGCDVSAFPASGYTTGFGYNPNETYSGGYTRPNNKDERVGQTSDREMEPDTLGPYIPNAAATDDVKLEVIEELPPSINRVATPEEIRDSLEDDGLPIEFAPPTI